MIIKKWITAICLVLIAAGAFAQAKETPKAQPLNQLDAQGQKNGLWWWSQPERMGEPAFTEFGNYDHGTRYGAWYKLDNEGELMSIENYRNDVLNGEAKYFEQGHLYCVGTYRGLNPQYTYDTVVVTDPGTGVETLRPVPSQKGFVKHGIWRYYDPHTGRLIREEEYQVDDLIYSKEFELTRADSLYYQQRIKTLPHNSGVKYVPPANRRHNYTNYKNY